MDNSKSCKHKNHQKTNTNSQKSKQSECSRVFIQFSMNTKKFPFSMFLLFSNFLSTFHPAPGSLKSKDSGLSPEPRTWTDDNYPNESGEFLVSLLVHPFGTRFTTRRQEEEDLTSSWTGPKFPTWFSLLTFTFDTTKSTIAFDLHRFSLSLSHTLSINIPKFFFLRSIYPPTTTHPFIAMVLFDGVGAITAPCRH